MTTLPDLEPAALEAAWLAHDNACPGEHWKKRERMAVAIRAYLSARSAPEAGKAVPQYWRDGTKLIEACLAKAVKADPLDVPMPLVGEEAALWHTAQAEAYRHALEMMGVPECMAALASSPAPTGAEPVAPTGEIAGLVNAIISRLIYPVSTEINPRGWEFRETSMLEEAVRFIKNEAAAALTASEAEAADLRRKLEEHQDAEDKAAREMATVIQGLRNRATAAERKLEEAERELDAAKHLSISLSKRLDDADYGFERDTRIHQQSRAEAAERKLEEARTALRHIANHTSMLDELENCMEMRRIAARTLSGASE